MSVLDAIAARKKEEAAALPAISVPAGARRAFVSSLLSRAPSLIAEIKPRSPSEGELLALSKVPETVRVYERHAQAISVLCDTESFGGGFDLLAAVRAMTDLPLLAKEFIVDARQIDHALSHGADAVLLIASILDDAALKSLANHALDAGADVLLEMHAEHEIERAGALYDSLPPAARSHLLIGINNRDLHTLATDLKTTETLAPLVRARMPDVAGVIAESGIATAEDVRRLAPLVQGFLVGTSLLQSRDPDALLSTLFPA